MLHRSTAFVHLQVVQASSDDTAHLQVSPVTRQDAGLYEARVQNELGFEMSTFSVCVLGNCNKLSLSSRRQTRATRCVTPIVFYTTVNAQCDKLTTVVDRTNLTARDGRRTIVKFLSVPAEFWEKFRREVLLFGGYTNFHTTRRMMGRRKP